MYARIITLQAKRSASIDEAMEIYREITRELQRRDGFLGSTFLMNVELRRAVTVTFWRDRISADSAGYETLPLLIDCVHELVDAPPDISGYDVIDHALLPSATARSGAT